MKTRFLFVLCCVFLSSMFFSCDNDDDKANVAVPTETRSSFEQKYPQASHLEWEYKDSYLVAEFKENGFETEAWFDNSGNWYMTVTESNYSLLPQVIKTDISAGAYSTWRIDDIKVIEQINTEKFYVIEVESGNSDAYLYYTTDGILFKTIDNSVNNEYRPETITGNIQAYINEHYPNARIIEIEAEDAIIEVDIIHEGRSKDVYFNLQEEWLYTSWELRRNEWPANVTSLVVTGQYAGYHIDDVDYIESATEGSYYLVELEKGNTKTNVKVPL